MNNNVMMSFTEFYFYYGTTSSSVLELNSISTICRSVGQQRAWEAFFSTVDPVLWAPSCEAELKILCYLVEG